MAAKSHSLLSLLLVFVLTGVLTFNSALGSNQVNNTVSNNTVSYTTNKGKKMDKEEQIDLQGSLIHITIRSTIAGSSSGIPFSVTKNSSFLKVYFLKDLNNITIEIFDKFGKIVYYNTINPITGGNLFISSINWNSGEYKISFSNNYGNSIYGSFEM
ncbi:hypothetical protein M2132_000009 [Dysgonomonas sp. PH5-45]|uniref:DUF3244 domain-containing protein n=1 Tax=unclassified Dysgonomonas TaxID=2630389 RepID=UPI002475B761|nr:MULTISPECIES: DUF3244 domain-containing protein [unclassified Dysgonomonas]MDH6353692.1 hypothetical protein [Dysgonomonas sp. PH5-45]MDH6386595.1 hypothetical protein [Dysgonomonas sp. PH5-37]